MTAHEIDAKEFYRLTGRWPEDNAVAGCVRCGTLWFQQGKTIAPELHPTRELRVAFYTCPGLLMILRIDAARHQADSSKGDDHHG